MLAVDERAAAVLSAFRRVGVEIGVYTGQLSRRLLASDPTLFLYMVDPYRSMDSAAYKETDDFHHRMTQDEHDAAMRTALDGAGRFPDRHALVRLPSVEAAKHFHDGSLDFVFIDGDHSYEGCKADIEAWWPKIRSRGFMSGHDYRDERNYGVKQAVHEWLGERELRLGPNYTWFVDKHGD